jgi:glucose-6-phosphate isomerase
MIKFDFKTYMKQPKENNKQIEDAYHKFLKENIMNEWYTKKIPTDLLEDLKQTSEKIKNNYDTVLVLGIGGSILGTKAIIKALSKTNKLVYIGETIEQTEINHIKNKIEDENIMLIVVSKSGNTFEINYWFDILYETLYKKYQNDIHQHIIAVTDLNSGKISSKLKNIDCKKYQFQEKIGGRFSIQTVASILPMYIADINVDEFINGYQMGLENKKELYDYINIRNEFYKNAYSVEILNIYTRRLEAFLDYVQQIFAETQGKNNKGLLPVPMINPAKLHSLGQYTQEGKNILFETTIIIENDITKEIAESVAEAHKNDNRYTNMIYLDEINAYNMGYLTSFFYMASALGAYLLNVNYYDQPGVTKYKEIMQRKLDNISK